MATDAARQDWFASYVGSLSALVADAGRINADLARRWASRSLADDAWTVDSMAGDALEAWDELTPLVERSLDLWLELVQRALRPGRDLGR